MDKNENGQICLNNSGRNHVTTKAHQTPPRGSYCIIRAVSLRRQPTTSISYNNAKAEREAEGESFYSGKPNTRDDHAHVPAGIWDRQPFFIFYFLTLSYKMNSMMGTRNDWSSQQEQPSASSPLHKRWLKLQLTDCSLEATRQNITPNISIRNDMTTGSRIKCLCSNITEEATNNVPCGTLFI